MVNLGCMPMRLSMNLGLDSLKPLGAFRCNLGAQEGRHQAKTGQCMWSFMLPDFGSANICENLNAVVYLKHLLLAMYEGDISHEIVYIILCLFVDGIR